MVLGDHDEGGAAKPIWGCTNLAKTALKRLSDLVSCYYLA